MPFSKRLRSQLFLSCSALAACGISSPLWADCTPDPTVTNSVTTCTGTDADGLVVSTSGTQVQVQPGALLQPGASPASIIVSNSATTNVDGTIDGGAVDGLLVTNGAPYQAYVPYDPYAGASPNYNAPSGYLTLYPSTNAYLAVGPGGSVTGNTAIRLRQRPDNATGLTNLSIWNSGMISGMSGPAIIVESGAAIGNINNVQGGTIGAISGLVRSIGNGGVIDGGALSAVDSSGFNFLSNTGAISSSSSVATLALGNGTVTNYGSIINNGAGPAISASGALSIHNYANGSITSNGATAVTAANALLLYNQGTISGTIDAHLATSGATIDTTGGMINGDIFLGSGDDLLIGGLLDTTTGTFSNITGMVDGGAGLDTVTFAITSDGTLNVAALPTNFERMRLSLANGAAVTLGTGLDLSNGISVGGSGSIINSRDITSTGSAISTYYTYPGALSVTNSGNIQSTLATRADFALNLGTIASGDNSGTITATGGGGFSAYIQSYGTTAFTNIGSIHADGPGVVISGKFDNQGVVQSTDDVGVINYNTNGALSINSGTIEGATAGIALNSAGFSNAGTIAAKAGIGVDLGSYAVFDNQSGGVVNGITAAIGISSTAYNVMIQNAGILNGDVNLIPQGGYDFSSDIFVDKGGTVNGNLLLGGGDDILVTDLGRSGTLAGVTGTVDAGTGNDTIRYRVSTNTSSTLSPPTSFESLGYEIANNSALTLTGSEQQDLSLTFSGQGSVDLNANLSQTDHVILDLTALNIAQLTGAGAGLPTDLHVISRGSLSVANSGTYSLVSAVNIGNSTFENAGTIYATAAATSSGYTVPVAIFSGTGPETGTIINSGTIALDGATGIRTYGSVTNTGSIVQTSGGAASDGISAVQLTNSGVISVDGIAVTATAIFMPSIVTNTGSIESRTNTAIVAGTVINGSGGRISGNRVAIWGSKISNAGIIDGDIMGATTYVADGGILNGNLSLGSQNDILLALNGGTGIGGTVDAGSGTDYFGRFYRSDATTQIGGTLPATFESELVESIGPNTTITLTGPSAPTTGALAIAGDGNIINRADISAPLLAFADTTLTTSGTGQLNSFTNAASLSGGFNGTLGSFSNQGSLYGNYELILTALNNSGAISSSWNNDEYGHLIFHDAGTVVNSGSVDGFLRIDSANSHDITLDNSGVVTGTLALYADLSLDQGNNRLSINNSGTIREAGSYAALDVSATPQGQTNTIAIANSGDIDASSRAASAFSLSVPYDPGNLTSIQIDNSGIISSSGEGVQVGDNVGYPVSDTRISTGLALHGGAGASVDINNARNGLIDVTGTVATAIYSSGPALHLNNAGTVQGGPGSYTIHTLYFGGGIFSTGPIPLRPGIITPSFISPSFTYTTYLAGAIQGSVGDDSITNTGTITGSIDLGLGNDSIENRGTLSGNIFLGDGDDRFLQALAASFTGTADGGTGSDTLTLDITGGGILDADLYSQFVNFENFELTGQGALTTQGAQPIQTLILDGATFDLQQGSTLQTLGSVAITGTGNEDHVC